MFSVLRHLEPYRSDETARIPVRYVEQADPAVTFSELQLSPWHIERPSFLAVVLQALGHLSRSPPPTGGVDLSMPTFNMGLA